MRDLNEYSREVELCCTSDGIVSSCDARAARVLGASAGSSLLALAAPGTSDKLRRFLSCVTREPVHDWELPLITGQSVATFLFSGRPSEAGHAELLGVRLPENYGTTVHQLNEAVAETVDLNREIGRQKHELQRAYQQLDESNRGVLTLHAELEDKADTLKRTADVRARLVANVSHEFRTPLHTILGLSKLLLDDTQEPLTEEQRKQVRYIRTSAEELSELVNDILDLSKAEAGKMLLRPERFSVAEFFGAIRGQLRPLLSPARGVELVFTEPDADFRLETDQGKVAQILRNLISNALKFTERGEVSLSVRRDGEQVRFSVTDTGIGIAAADQERIFEEFNQVENELQRRVKGTGLGLALSRRLADLLGGELTVESELGQGSTFTLSIPAVHPEVQELAQIAHRPLDPTKAPVLVVEDDRKTIFVYEKYLAMAGFQVLPARTTDDARQLLRAMRPAAVVLDVMLEGETTWEFLAELKKNPETCDIPVLVVTVTSKAQKARALGADEFWLKPIDQDRLIRKLKSVTRPGAPTKVLIIDDDERSRYLVKRLLDGTPFVLTEAGTGPEGVRIAQELRPNVILLDFLLRDVTAFDVLDDLKADPRTRKTPVIVITSHVLDEEAKQRLAAETEAILSKETLSRELAINRIRDALNKAGVGGSHVAGANPQ